MIDLYYWPTPNGWKVSMMLEECSLPYELIPVNIGRGDQFKPEFLSISPNNRMPAIVDHGGIDGDISVFESGAILIYLGEKTGRFLSSEHRDRWQVLQWVFWQMGGLGPMAGQLSHFVNYAPEPMDYPLNRYRDEYNRLLGVMDRQLKSRPFLAGEYSIADMASWPWVRPYERFGQVLDDFPNLRRWFDEIAGRPAVQKAVAIGQDWWSSNSPDEATRKNLFNQTAASVARMIKEAAKDDSDAHNG